MLKNNTLHQRASVRNTQKIQENDLLEMRQVLSFKGGGKMITAVNFPIKAIAFIHDIRHLCGR